MALLGSSSLGVFSFFASSHSSEQCGSNGLPLTPNSIRMLGRFQRLKSTNHAHLCQYVDIVRAKNERMLVVSECHEGRLEDVIMSGRGQSLQFLQRTAFQLLLGLNYLHSADIIHRNLAPTNIVLTQEGIIKLSQYALYYMTDCGREVSFAIGSPRYMAPEVIAAGTSLCEDSIVSGQKGDVWSLGICILETYLGCHIWPELSVKTNVREIIRRVITLAAATNGEALGSLLAFSNFRARPQMKEMPDDMTDFLRKCLTVASKDRATTIELLNHPWLLELYNSHLTKKPPLLSGSWCFDSCFRSDRLSLLLHDDINKLISSMDDEEDHLAQRPLSEVYYLWTLAGGDLESELKKQGRMKSKPPIMQLASAVLPVDNALVTCGLENDSAYLFNEKEVILSLSQLRQRLKNIDDRAFYPLLEGNRSYEVPGPAPDMTDLPLIIREKDIEYQFHRVILFQRLLEGDIHDEFAAIDKETETSTDRQIEVDIPRCHQYDELLSSPTAHAKFKRVIKAWLFSNFNWVYWQGLDSLTAPFLHLHFSDEAMAFACLKAFIPKYLNDFFLQDNSSVVQEYLAVFSHLIAYHEPELYTHLKTVGFDPELYAIPWFLTMYTHVLPMAKIVRLWDILLLGNSSLPLCIGIAILMQLKDLLLSFGFNECILLFSDLPDIDIQKCVDDSKRISRSTPLSAAMRRHDKTSVELASEGQGIGALGKIRLPSDEDTDVKTFGQADVEMITLAQHKAEACPRVSVSDLVFLCGLQDDVYPIDSSTGFRSKSPTPSPTPAPTSDRKKPKAKAVVVDIRSQQEFNRGHVPRSLNLPQGQSFSREGALLPTGDGAQLKKQRGKSIIVFGNKHNDTAEFGRQLVYAGFPRVCVLLGTASTLRSIGLLSSIPDEP
ncbi:TBC domain-containing protein kinase-like protein isoform X2 [Corticium candelabrum]|uniref:TBC domain-containing protein kinase-like protein isoform X2 n=1 Tax=Corticium candelabrum TaxID=121492 RepID=UPI002E255F91|nr:TBC domain-containing protein kinase-like protein isoform X2 [Corticium candelabrum]